MNEELYNSLDAKEKEEYQYLFLRDSDVNENQILLYEFHFPEFNTHLKLLADNKMTDPWFQNSY